jgi:hypothetical protein
MKIMAVLGTLALGVSAVGAVSYDLAADVPSTLGGSDYAPNQIVRSDDAAYALDLTLPDGVQLGALHRKPDDVWLFSPAHPVDLDATAYEPRDVVAYDESVYTMHLDGSSAGIPAGARIDALFFDAAGRAVLSFDVPVDLGGTFYGRSDLVLREVAGFSLYWDAESAGVPLGSNLVGAAKDDAGTLVLTFDVPTDLGATTYMPGDLVRWEGGSAFSLYFQDAFWPPGSQLRGLAFAPVAGGYVPDGADVSGTQLRIGKAGAEDVTLAWGPSCLSTDTDYEVYEGTLGDFGSHAPVLCSTGGATMVTLTPEAGDRYFLAVPRNGMREGSYGLDASDVQRPQAVSACLIQEIGTCD